MMFLEVAEVSRNIFTAFQEGKKERLIFSMPKGNMKSRSYGFSSYNQTKKVLFRVNLELNSEKMPLIDAFSS